MNKKKKHWYEYLWVASSLYLILGLFNILFAWLGMLCFLIPLLVSMFSGSKKYCNRYCGRGQLFELLGKKLRLSNGKACPAWMRSKYFRYGFLLFFLTMFMSMLMVTISVFQETKSLSSTITVLWTFRLPWTGILPTTTTPWIMQYAYGFYSIMLTSTILGLFTMLRYKPRTWCVYCPMGTMTQAICKAKNGLSKS